MARVRATLAKRDAELRRVGNARGSRAGRYARWRATRRLSKARKVDIVRPESVKALPSALMGETQPYRSIRSPYGHCRDARDARDAALIESLREKLSRGSRRAPRGCWTGSPTSIARSLIDVPKEVIGVAGLAVSIGQLSVSPRTGQTGLAGFRMRRGSLCHGYLEPDAAFTRSLGAAARPMLPSLLSGSAGYQLRRAGCTLQVARLLPVSLSRHRSRRRRRRTRRRAGRAFRALALDDLVITRRDFRTGCGGLTAHWRICSRCSSTGDSAAPCADEDFRSGCSDLADAEKASSPVPPSIERQHGEARSIHCLTRGLWLGERDGVRFAALLDVREGRRGLRARLEVARARRNSGSRWPRGSPIDCARGEKRRFLEGKSWCWNGHATTSTSHLPACACRRPRRYVAQISSCRENARADRARRAGFRRRAERLARSGLSAGRGVLLYRPPGQERRSCVRWLAGLLQELCS